MAEALSHRGTACNISEHSGFWLVHRLHSMVGDLEQPLVHETVLSANCEIYNWRELAEDRSIEARNDADLLHGLLESEGNECLEDLDGIYAFAYLEDGEIVLARDILGVNPVWYTEDPFRFASERQALEPFGKPRELHPRRILRLDTEQQTLDFEQRGFFETRETEISEQEAIREAEELFLESLEKRVPDQEVAVLFSGGVDSAVVAAGLKQLEKDFTCYVCGTSPGNTSRPRDVEKARETAEAMDLELDVVEPSLEEVRSRLPELADAISSTSPVKLPVALTLDFALDGGEKCAFSGLGSEQLYAGYARQQGYLNRECLSDLRGMFHRDLYRDNIVGFRNGKELRLPFLDHDLVEHALGISPELKRRDGTGKYVLRQVAENLGVPEEIVWRDKLAAQYGSNMTKAVRKLAGDHTMEEFTHGLRDRSNHRLAALTSGGKDSCAALYRASKRNNEISCLVTLESANPDSYMFDTETSVVRRHAEDLDLPLLVQKTEGEKEKELEDLSAAMRRARQEHDVDGVVCGAIRSTYQRDRVERIAERHGLKVFAPLWAWDEEDYMRWLVREGFDIKVVDTAARGLEESWIGRALDDGSLEELLSLADKHSFNAAGEGGEYETEVRSFPDGLDPHQ